MTYKDGSLYVQFLNDPDIKKVKICCQKFKFPFNNIFSVSLKNIGWINDSSNITRDNNIDPEFVEKLFLLCSKPVSLTRGLHICQLCNYENIIDVIMDCGVQGIKKYYLHESNILIYKNKIIPIGNGEIWIPYGRNMIFIAPTMILHYVLHHGYSPPFDFIKAVINNIDFSPNLVFGTDMSNQYAFRSYNDEVCIWLNNQLVLPEAFDKNTNSL